MNKHEKTLWLAVFDFEIANGAWMGRAIEVANAALSELRLASKVSP